MKLIFPTISILNCKIVLKNYLQDLISKVIGKNPRYKNVYDIIQHVEEMANIRKLGSRLKISDSDDDEETEHHNTEVIL